MLIDCADCVMRDVACGDCVVTFLIGPPERSFEPVEQAALAALAEGGLVPPLRMVPTPPDPGSSVPRSGAGPGPLPRAPDGPSPRENGPRRVAGSA